MSRIAWTRDTGPRADGSPPDLRVELTRPLHSVLRAERSAGEADDSRQKHRHRHYLFAGAQEL